VLIYSKHGQMRWVESDGTEPFNVRLRACNPKAGTLHHARSARAPIRGGAVAYGRVLRAILLSAPSPSSIDGIIKV